MADSYGISEAGKAWIYVSVQNDTEEAFKKVADDLQNFSATVQKEISVVDKPESRAARSISTPVQKRG